MVLFENEFLHLALLEPENVIKATWKASSEEMKSKDFRHCISLLWHNLLERKPKALLADTRFFLYTIDIPDQTWYAENIPNFGIDTSKVAMLMSERFVEQLSIEQSIEEDTQSGTLTGYFKDEEEALKWILSL